MITLFGLLLGGSVALLKKYCNRDVSTIRLWFGCVLAQLNGKCLGRKEIMKWMPFGTLNTNVSAYCVGYRQTLFVMGI